MDDNDPEPSLADYSDLHRWDKWFAWERRREKRENEPYRTDGNGRVEYAHE